MNLWEILEYMVNRRARHWTTPQKPITIPGTFCGILCTGCDSITCTTRKMHCSPSNDWCNHEKNCTCFDSECKKNCRLWRIE